MDFAFSGLSGVIKFDTYGMRTDFSMEVLELQDTGLEPCGTWTNIDGLNMTREQDVTTASNPVNIMANKTFVVTLIENQPYTMLKEDVCQKLKTYLLKICTQNYPKILELPKKKKLIFYLKNGGRKG